MYSIWICVALPETTSPGPAVTASNHFIRSENIYSPILLGPLILARHRYGEENDVVLRLFVHGTEIEWPKADKISGWRLKALSEPICQVQRFNRK